MRDMPLFVLVLVLTFLSEIPTNAQMPATRVVVAEAQMIEARSTIMLVGTVEPSRRSRVSTEIAGLVREMSTREGDSVSASGVICRLNDDTLRLRLAAETAKLAGLQARHAELLAGLRKEELRRLEALLDEAVAEYERWKFEMERIEGLRASSDSNAKEYEDTRAEFLTAERRRIAVEASYNLGVEGTREEVKAQAAHAVAQQQAEVDRMATDLRKTAIRAPFDGYVVDRLVEVGEWISVGEAVVEMVDLRRVLVRVDVPESAFPYLVDGDTVRVTIDALKRPFDGRIKHIMRQADANARTFPVEIEVGNGEGLLAGGMFARATIAAGPKENIVAVPGDAIVEKDGTTYIAMVMPGPHGTNGMLVPVTVGTDVGDQVTITSGNVAPGTPVVTRGTERIMPFPSPVVIVDEMGTPVAMPDHAPSPPDMGGL